jgi:hypothetical protein
MKDAQKGGMVLGFAGSAPTGYSLGGWSVLVLITHPLLAPTARVFRRPVFGGIQVAFIRQSRHSHSGKKRYSNCTAGQVLLECLLVVRVHTQFTYAFRALCSVAIWISSQHIDIPT